MAIGDDRDEAQVIGKHGDDVERQAEPLEELQARSDVAGGSSQSGSASRWIRWRMPQSPRLRRASIAASAAGASRSGTHPTTPTIHALAAAAASIASVSSSVSIAWTTTVLSMPAARSSGSRSAGPKLRKIGPSSAVGHA